MDSKDKDKDKDNQIINVDITSVTPTNSSYIRNMTLGELRDHGIDVTTKKDSVKLIRNTEDTTMVLESKDTRGLNTITQHTYIKTKDKQELAKMARELYSQKYTQTEIAEILGTHQSQVSNLIRGNF